MTSGSCSARRIAGHGGQRNLGNGATPPPCLQNAAPVLDRKRGAILVPYHYYDAAKHGAEMQGTFLTARVHASAGQECSSSLLS